MPKGQKGKKKSGKASKSKAAAPPPKPAAPPPVSPKVVPQPPAKPGRKPGTVEQFRAYREDDAAHKQDMRSQARDVAREIDIADPKRRAAATASFQVFCETYFPEQFTMAWSADHLRVLAHIDRAATAGGLFAFAMPRGSGKTTICECGAIWAILTGRRQFVVLIGASEKHATEIVESIKSEMETNDLLADDFPEALAAIRALDGIAHRANGQLWNGERTHIGWTADELILPDIKVPEWCDIPDHAPYVDRTGRPKCAGAIVRVAGITGRIRGMKFKRADGKAVRPDFVLLDDPQTDESAKSPSQCEYRESVLAGAILGLAGRGKRIAGVMPCTVIRQGDMADRILDRNEHPDWNGERTKMVYDWPTDTTLWDTYGQIRSDGLRAGDDGVAATQFYREHRAAMDAGARVAWPECFQSNELSAIQNAMNLRLTLGDPAFFAEYQNEPIEDESVAKGSDLTSDAVAARVNGMQRFAIPSTAHHLTAFIDVHAHALYYGVCAYEDDFTGYVADYGAWPDQKRSYYTLRDIRITMGSVIRDAKGKAAGQEGQIFGALTALVGQLVATSWKRDDGSAAAIDRIMIDANWGQSTEVIYDFCRRSPHSALIYPSHGKFIGASSKPLGEWQRHRGDRSGHHWKIPAAQGRQVRHVIIDTNYWKTFVMQRFVTAIGDPGALTVFGNDGAVHRLFSEHMCSEYRVPTEGRGRKVDEWKWRPEQFDNHWWDCMVGCAVGASIEGVSVGAGDGEPKRVRIRLSDLAKARQVKPTAVHTESANTPADAAQPAPAPSSTPAPSPPSGGRIRLSDKLRERRR